MQLHQIRLTQKNKSKKRIGRGGKRGTYSGKGNKGQKSRAGHKIRPAGRDLILKIPKLSPKKKTKLRSRAINISAIEKRFAGDVIITSKSLLQAGLVSRSDKKIKILGMGEIKRPLKIRGLELSASAKKKIEAAGGQVE